MYFLGLLSIAQMFFLPGLVLLRALRLPIKVIPRMLAAIPLSLTLNHFLVIGLVLVHGYRPLVLYTVVCLESLALFMPGSQAAASHGPPSTTAAPSLLETIRSQDLVVAAVWWMLLFLSSLVLIVHLGLATQNVGSVFDVWDAVVSWNRWAQSWAGGALPELTWRYPQVLPTNISIGYVLMQDAGMQLFVKAAMAIFPVAQLLMLADLGIRRRSLGFLAALCLVGSTDLFTHRAYLFSGYADLPVAFMITASLYLGLLAEEATGRRERRLLLGLAVAASAGAALTKQSGLLWAAVAPVLAAQEWRRLEPQTETPAERRRTTRQLLAVYAGLSLALVGPWYGYKSLQIRAGTESDERNLIALLNADQTYAQRAKHLVGMLSGEAPAVLWGVLPLAAVGALLSSRWRWHVLLYGIPYAVICATFTNYDLRNLVPVWPVLFLSGALGWEQILGRFQLAGHCTSRADATRLPVLLGAGLAVVIPRLLLEGHLSRNGLLYHQLTQQREIGLPALNEMLYRYDKENGLKGRIVTSYQLLRYLPGLGSRYVYDDFRDLEHLRTQIAQSENRYLLIPVNAPLRDYVEGEVAAGRGRLLAEAGPPWSVYRFIELLGPGKP